MHGKVIDMTPCNKCTDLMKQGIILITIDPDKSEPGWNRASMPNPYRTGGWFVVRDEAVERFAPSELAEWAKKHRFMFIEHQAAERVGLFAPPEPKE